MHVLQPAAGYYLPINYLSECIGWNIITRTPRVCRNYGRNVEDTHPQGGLKFKSLYSSDGILKNDENLITK